MSVPETSKQLKLAHHIAILILNMKMNNLGIGHVHDRVTNINGLEFSNGIKPQPVDSNMKCIQLQYQAPLPPFQDMWI